MHPLVVAVDIGGTKLAAAAVEPDGVLALRRVGATPASAGPQAIVQTVLDLCRQVFTEVREQGRNVAAVGVGSAGHVDHERGVISYASAILPGWSGFALRQELQARLGLPVSIENDVNALALGEAHFGAGRGYTSALYVAVGTGIGGALICEGRLQRGASWTTGEIGHVVIDWDGARRCACGETGHLEAYVAGPALAARYAEMAGLERPPDLREVASRARSGDQEARLAIEEGARILGLALGGLLNVLDPQALIVGGGVVELNELWWPALEASLRSNAMPGPARIPLLRAALGTDAVLVGAAWLALSEHYPELAHEGGV